MLISDIYIYYSKIIVLHGYLLQGGTLINNLEKKKLKGKGQNTRSI